MSPSLVGGFKADTSRVSWRTWAKHESMFRGNLDKPIRRQWVLAWKRYLWTGKKKPGSFSVLKVEATDLVKSSAVELWVRVTWLLTDMWTLERRQLWEEQWEHSCQICEFEKLCWLSVTTTRAYKDKLRKKKGVYINSQFWRFESITGWLIALCM